MSPTRFFVWDTDWTPTLAHLHDRDPPELAEIDWRLADGLPVGDSFPSELVFDLHRDWGIDLADVLPNTSGLLVVSQKLRNRLVDVGKPIEVFPVRVRNHRGGIEPDPYFIVNLLEPADCVDLEKSDMDYSAMDPTQAFTIRRLALDEKKIPSARPVFRVRVNPRVHLVREDLARALVDELGCRGCAFTSLEDFGEEWRDPPED